MYEYARQRELQLLGGDPSKRKVWFDFEEPGKRSYKGKTFGEVEEDRWFMWRTTRDVEKNTKTAWVCPLFTC
jgi:hypothetical protein